MTVKEFLALDYDEYIGWMDYFRLRPPGWREDLRTYYIMASFAGDKVKAEDIFPSLKAMKAANEEDEAEAVAKSLRASSIGMLLNARGIK